MSVKRSFSLSIGRYLLTALAGIGAATPACAQNREGWQEAPWTDTLGYPVWRTAYRVNPVSYASLQRPGQTVLSTRYAHWSSEGLNTPFEGTGGEHFRIAAQGYGVEEGKDVFSAAAAFSTGRRNETRWSDVCDVEMLYPYLLGDAQGGEYREETYHLSGGYARFVGRHILGLRVAYTGEMAHRNRDPRPKNTVSNLSFNPGWTLRFASGHSLGAFVRYTYYKQHVSLKVEEANRSYIFYRMRGMGLFDRMFTQGETSLARYYFSDAVSGGLQWEKSGKNAFEVIVLANYRSIRTEESDNRIPFITRRTSAALHGTYRHAAGRNAWILSLCAETGVQKGYERTYQRITTDSQSGVQIWSLQSETMRDKIRFTRASLRADYRQAPHERTGWRYGLQIDYCNGEERFTLPQYHLRTGGITPGADWGFLRRGHKGYELSGSLRLAYRMHTDCSIAAADPANEPLVEQMLQPLYDYLKKDYAALEAEAVYRIPVKGFNLCIEAAGGYAAARANCDRWTASIGLSLRR